MSITTRTTVAQTSGSSGITGVLLRKCACGTHTIAGKTCDACLDQQPPAFQAKLRVGAAGSAFEQEADRLASAVVRGKAVRADSLLRAPTAVHRQEPPKEKSTAEKLKEAAGKVGDAFLKTPLGKDIKDRATALGEQFVSTLPGKIITGAAAAGAITGIVATNTELPVGIPEIPLDVVYPGLKLKITYEGPAQKPTKAAISFSGTFGGPKPAPGAKPPVSEKEKFKAGTARMAEEQRQFREGLKTPEQRAAEDKQFWDAYWRMQSEDPLNLLRLRGTPPAAAPEPEPLAAEPELPAERKREDETLQRQARAGTERRWTLADEAPAAVYTVLSSSGGHPLDPGTRSYMEAHLGYDFGDVRVHTGLEAEASTRAVNALAYTVGRDLVFDPGQYAPQTSAGRLLLAHELVHTIQQGAVLPLTDHGSMGWDAVRREPSPAPEPVGNALAPALDAGDPPRAAPGTATQPAMPGIATAATPSQPSITPQVGRGTGRAVGLHIQTQLMVDTPDDPYEREADRVADQVMRAPRLDALPADEGEDEDGTPQLDMAPQNRFTAPALSRSLAPFAPRLPSPYLAPQLEATIGSLKGNGNPLPGSERIFFEERMGGDFRNVRLHTGAHAARAARALNARAFTVGADIFFHAGEFQPSTWDGRRLLAHELTHVIQQGAAPLLQVPARAPSPQALPQQRLAADRVQRLFGISLDDIPGIDANAIARHIPGYTLFTVIIGFNPITGQRVAPSAMNLLEGLMGLVPFGTAIFDTLQERGILQDAFNWVRGQLDQLDLSLARIERTLQAAWDDVRITRGFDYNIGVVRRHFGRLYNDVQAFARSLVDHIIQLIKDAALDVAEGLLAENRAWALIRKILGRDPLRDEPVEATPVEILEDFLLLIDKQQELEQMRERGTLQETADWLATQLATFMSLLEELGGLFTEAWEAIQPENLPNLMTNLERLANRAIGFLQTVWDFATTVAAKVLELIKNALLSWLSEFAHEVPGFHLITVILGKNPFTQEAVPRTAQNIIRGFITLLPGGNQQYEQLEQTGTISQAAERIEGAMEALGISWSFITGLFTGIWESLSIEDLIDPIGAFTRIRDQFGEPISRLFAFIQVVLREIFSLILELMHFPTDILQRIINNALQAFEDIKRDPVGFLVNMLEAVKLGFSHFFDNILQHLLAGVTDWLFGQLREAGIEPPTEITLESMLGLVVQILGISMDRIWEKLAERIGQETVDRIRGAIDRLTGIWNFVRDVQERGFTAIWEYIESQISNLWDTVLEQVRDWIMTRIIERVTARLLSMLDPTGVMAVVNSFVAFFNAVQSAIQYFREMLEIVDRYVATIAAVAHGELEPGAQQLEQGLADSIPVAIGFLANQVGLGDLASRISEIIAGVREMVDRALDWLLDQAMRLGQALLDRLAGRTPEEAQPAPAEQTAGQPSPEANTVKTDALQAVTDLAQQQQFTSFEDFHDAVDRIQRDLRARGLGRLSVAADPNTLQLTVSASASLPDSITITWAQVFENTPADDAKLNALLEDFRTGGPGHRDTYAAIAVNGRHVDNARNARGHAEIELLGSAANPSQRWLSALNTAVTEAGTGHSEFALLINRSPCGATCTPALATWLRRNRSQYPSVRFHLAAHGLYQRALHTRHLRAMVQEHLEAVGQQDHVPFGEMKLDELRAFMREVAPEGGNYIFDNEQSTSFQDLMELQRAGWTLHQLDAGIRSADDRPRPAANVLASKIRAVRQKIAQLFNKG